MEKLNEEIHEGLSRLRLEESEYNKQRTNIRTDVGLELVEKNTTNITEFFTAILDKWNGYFKQHPVALGMELSNTELNHMELLNKV